MSLYDKASLILPVSPAYKDGALQSYKPLTSEGTFTFSRGSNLAATRVDVNGLIEKGRENLLLQSNNFNTTWATNNSSVTSGQSGYDGSSDAWKMISGASGTYSMVSQSYSGSGVHTLSLYAKAAEWNYIALFMEAGGGASKGAIFDLTTGALTNTIFGSLISYSSNSAGNGWWKLSVTLTGAITGANIYLCEVGTSHTSNNNDGTSGVYIQDAQLEQSLVATGHIETGATTAQAGILEDLPRLDYSGGATCPSLLLEGSRTNLIDYSEYFGGWSITRVAVNSNADDSPEGRANATKVVPNTSSGEHFVARGGFNRTAGEYLSHTIYAKADGYNYLYISNAASRLYGVYNLSNGSVEYVNSNGVDFTNHSASVESVGNGWYRCTLIGQALVTVSTYMRLACAPYLANTHTPSFAGDGTSGALIYGAQVETNASYPTSYIPNHSGGTITRAADVLGNSNNISGLFNDNQGTLYFQTESTIFKGLSSNSSFFGLTESSSGNFFRFRGKDTNILTQSIGFGSNINFNPSGATFTKYLYKWDGTNIKLFVDGVEGGSVSQTATFNPDLFKLGFNSTFVSNTKQLLLFPTALSDAECIALTTI